MSISFGSATDIRRKVQYSTFTGSSSYVLLVISTGELFQFKEKSLVRSFEARFQLLD